MRDSNCWTAGQVHCGPKVSTADSNRRARPTHSTTELLPGNRPGRYESTSCEPLIRGCESCSQDVRKSLKNGRTRQEVILSTVLITVRNGARNVQSSKMKRRTTMMGSFRHHCPDRPDRPWSVPGAADSVEAVVDHQEAAGAARSSGRPCECVRRAPWRACRQPPASSGRKLPGIGPPGSFRGRSEISSLTMADVSRDRVVPAGVGPRRVATSP